MAKSKPSSDMFNMTESAEEFLEQNAPTQRPKPTKRKPTKRKPGRPKTGSLREEVSKGTRRSCTVYLEPEVHQKLRVLAATQDKQLSEVVSQAIVDAYDSYMS